MDFDLEIINEEDDCPNHLFESIMNAMNSMKEATADKIYQKIQREGDTNYSKPQVDKALANALKYGIFEVRNNRYRVRDDILDDEDTVYWKLQEKKDRTPFRIQERISEKQFGLKLDPERDNQRFRKISKTEIHQCPHCGRIKKIEHKKGHAYKKLEKVMSKKKMKNKKLGRKNNQASYRISGLSRKEWHDRRNEEFPLKKKKPRKNTEKEYHSNDKLLNDFWTETKDLREKDSFDSRYSNMNLLEADGNLESYTKDNQNESFIQNELCESQRIQESEGADDKQSSISKSDTESEGSSVTSHQNLISQEDFWESVTKIQEKKMSDRNENSTDRDSYLRSREGYNSEYENSQADKRKRNLDWLEESDEPQGTIRHSNNMLTIEPMDSLTFENPGQASYIT